MYIEWRPRTAAGLKLRAQTFRIIVSTKGGENYEEAGRNEMILHVMRTFSVLAIFQVCFAVTLRSQSSSSDISRRMPACDTTWNMTIDPYLPPYRFHVVSLTDSEGQNLFIAILNSRTGDTIQVIKQYVEQFLSPVQVTNPIDFVDINLDGYPDLSYVEAQGATGNQGCAYWLYDKSAHRFVINEAYSRLVNAYVDSAKRQIRTYYKCGGGCYEFTVYDVHPDRPVPRAFLSLRPDATAGENERYICSRGRFDGGKKINIEHFLAGPEVFKFPEVPPWWPTE
jgi:hypothetical protein